MALYLTDTMHIEYKMAPTIDWSDDGLSLKGAQSGHPPPVHNFTRNFQYSL